MKAVKIIAIIFCSTSLIFFSCKRTDEKITASHDARLEFSADSIFFDTIFTSVGSITKAFFVFNRNKNAVKISSIQLGGMATSDYTITIDGDQTYFKSNVELKGNDSMLVLVKVLIDPQSQNTPYLVSDSIIFNTNENIQQVKLLAYGQDANFLNSVTLPCNTTWSSAKPYVIYNTVTVPAGCSLTISKGVKVYSHKNSFIDVQGTLIVQGAPDSLVRFEGDNLAERYSNLSAQWKGIVFESGSKNNSIDWAYIKNAETGISMKQEADADTIAELLISNSVIRNMSAKGIEAMATDLYAYNCVVSNCADNIFSGSGGGNYFFRHCTLAAYSYSFFRSSAAVQLSNFSSTVSGMLYSRMINTVIYGDLNGDELTLGDNGSSGFDIKADNCLIKKTVAVSGSNNLNLDPRFQNPAKGDFHPDSTAGSPLIDAGQFTGILNDLDNKVRDATPDIGAYEK